MRAAVHYSSLQTFFFRTYRLFKLETCTARVEIIENPADSRGFSQVCILATQEPRGAE